MLQKGIYLYKCMDNWKKETSLPKKEEFYSNVNLECITDAACKHATRVWEDLEIKNLGECCDLHRQSDTLLLADVFESFRNSYIGLDLDHILSAPGHVRHA